MHFVRICQIAFQGVGHAHQVMCLLEETGCDERGLVDLRAVDSIILGFPHGPLLAGELQGRYLHIVAPMLDILNNDLFGRMHGETAGDIFRPGVCNTPGVDDVHLPLHRAACMHHPGVEQQINRFVLVDEPLRFSASDNLLHILFCCQHGLTSYYRWMVKIYMKICSFATRS